MPFETSELYKRYMINLRMPESVDLKPSKEAEALAKKLSESLKIKFDLIITDSEIRSASKNIEISDAGMVDPMSRHYMPGEDKVASFVHAYAKSAIVIRVPDKQKASLNLLSVNHSPLPIFISMAVGDNASLELSEYYFSASKEQSVVAPLHELSAGKNSKVELNILHDENGMTDVGNLCKGRIGERAEVRVNMAYIGGGHTRSRANFTAAEHGKIQVSEVAFGSDGQKFDMATNVTNEKPYSIGRVDSGAVMSGKSLCVLKGFAKIVEGARGVGSQVNQHGLLLDPESRIEALPDMSIDYSNEVSASHSAGTAPISNDVLFYMTSRGIPEDEARRLYIIGFLSKYLTNISNVKAKEVIVSVLLEKLNKKTFGMVPNTDIEKFWLVQKA